MPRSIGCVVVSYTGGTAPQRAIPPSYLSISSASVSAALIGGICAVRHWLRACHTLPSRRPCAEGTNTACRHPCASPRRRYRTESIARPTQARMGPLRETGPPGDAKACRRGPFDRGQNLTWSYALLCLETLRQL